ncbi:MAG TPA: hypothetical protein VNF68_15665 [Candidatus Baltobacteraceae bacterium]|nr:hypothetical protein [Candidatus Baltobacteraceae bacterium]
MTTRANTKAKAKMLRRAMTDLFGFDHIESKPTTVDGESDHLHEYRRDDTTIYTFDDSVPDGETLRKRKYHKDATAVAIVAALQSLTKALDDANVEVHHALVRAAALKSLSSTIEDAKRDGVTHLAITGAWDLEDMLISYRTSSEKPSKVVEQIATKLHVPSHLEKPDWPRVPDMSTVSIHDLQDAVFLAGATWIIGEPAGFQAFAAAVREKKTK